MQLREYDVVCIGGGGAGVSAAVRAGQLGARVALISKDPIGYGCTRLAAGNMACTGVAAADSVERFVDDILSGGDDINNRRLAEVVAAEAPSAAALMESFGYIFRRDPKGRVSEDTARRAGGHTIRRTIGRFAGGVSLGQVLRAASARSHVAVYEDMIASRLLIRNGRVEGVVGLHLTDGEVFSFSSKSVILATGGAGWLYYPHTDCPKACTGDGFALALRAGAELVDMEQVQFLPFALNHPRSMIGQPVGEPSSAGRYGQLLNNKGEVVLEGMNRMTRAQVANVIGLEVKKGNGTKYGGLLLDLAPNIAKSGQSAWDTVYSGLPFGAIRVAYGEKAFRWEEPWDVTPSAHFTMGGVRIDEYGRTSLEGLYAAGEVAGGLHGGNRLGSVALTEIFIFGERAGEQAAKDATKRKQPAFDGSHLDEEKRLTALFGATGRHHPTRLMRRLQRAMWDKVGVVRDKQGLLEGLEEIETIARLSEDLATPENRQYNLAVADAVELQLMLDVARATTLAAQERRESRGAHVRSDFPDRNDEAWRQNIVTVYREGRIESRVVPIGRDVSGFGNG